MSSSHVDPTAPLPDSPAAPHAGDVTKDPLPYIHLVDGDGVITRPDCIIDFLNTEVAGVDRALVTSSSVASVPSLSLSPKSKLDGTAASGGGGANFCHQYIRQVVGLGYHVVGVFGGQSSGKSTLLNAAFGTHFATMNAEEGRHQTTKGAFMSVTTSQPGHLDVVAEPVEDEEGTLLVPRPGRAEAPLKDPLLVVDFEGTDGIERGEDQSLERHLSLFALSIADTLIVNMWTTEVGRFNGGNLSLLRTVFEVNLQLFSHDSNLEKERPTLLFVMRDHSKPAYFAKDCDRVRDSIDKIWSTITKPPPAPGAAEGTGDSIDRFFSIKFFAFPHYELQRGDFIEQLKVFRTMFVSNGAEDTKVFASPNSFRGIPLEAVPQYMGACWESIVKSKDLDIPTQREMLSRFRCRELVEERAAAYKTFTAALSDRMTEKGDVTAGGRIADGRPASGAAGTSAKPKPTLQALLQTEFDRHVSEYNEASRLYAPRVVADCREALRAELLGLYDAAVKVQVGTVIKEVMRNLEGDVHEMVDKVVRTHIWQCPAVLRIGDMPLASAPSAASGDAAATGAALPSAGEGINVRAIVRAFWKALCEGTRTLAASVSSAEDSVQQQLLGRCFGVVRADAALRDLVSGQLNIAVATLIRKRLEAMAADAAGGMQKAFEHVLNHNPDGSLRIFSTPEGLQKQFRPARYAGLILAACLFYARMEVKEHASSLEALMHGGEGEGEDEEGDAALDSDEEHAPLGRTQSANKDLFARTMSSMTNVSVTFRENVAEKDFYLDLGAPTVGIDAIAAAVSSGSASLAANRSNAAVLSGSDKGGIAVGYGVLYPSLPVSQSGAATPRFVERAVSGAEADGDAEADEAAADDEAADEDGEEEEGAEMISLHNILITRSALRRSLQLYHQQIYFTFQVQLTNVEAKAKGAHIPLGMWIALLYFAHDEIFYVLRSPVLLILLLLAGYFFFSAFLQAKWKEFEESGPPVVVAFIRQGLVMAKPYLDGINEQIKPLQDIGKTDGEAPKADGGSVPSSARPTPAASHINRLPTAAEESADGLRRRAPHAPTTEH